MPCCAIKWCQNHSRTSNVKKDNVTFHQFPSSSKVRQKWIKATRRPESWLPTKHTCVCSKHFTPNSFTYSKANRRRLDPEAVPSLFLPVFNNDNQDMKVENEESKNITASDPPETLNSTSAIDTLTAREKKLFYLLKTKLREIKRLQYHNRILKKKVKSLSEMLQEVKEKKLSATEIKEISAKHKKIISEGLVKRHAVFLEVE